jgi:glycosyl transferase family 25
MERFQEFLQKIPQTKEAYECVRLFRNKSRRQKAYVVEKLGSANLCKFTKGHMSATGYYLTPSGANKLLHNAREWLLPVDMYMDQFWLNGVECYGLVPPCLTNDAGLESMIGYEPRDSQPPRTYLQRLRREMFSLIHNSLKGLHNLRFRVLNPRLERLDERQGS